MVVKNWKITQLWTYPIKSCAGISWQQARVGVHGFEHDRRFMIVDRSTGMGITQRNGYNKDTGALEMIGIKSMCLIKPVIKPADHGQRYYVEVSAPGMGRTQIYPELFIGIGGFSREVQIWGKTYTAITQHIDQDDWFNRYLNKERPGDYQVVMMSRSTIRRASRGYSQLRWPDGYPVNFVSEESLADLNSHIPGEVIPMDRFRPNIVIAGGRPYDEDRIDRMVINDVEFEGITPCVRCPTTQTNQQTAKKGKEPMKTLLEIRPYGENSAVFGRNANHLSMGDLHVGDTVTATVYRENATYLDIP